MAYTRESARMEQSRRITRLGCVGLILVLVLIFLISMVAVRNELSGKRGMALDKLTALKAQIQKAPGILNRMLAFGCGEEAEEAVRELDTMVSSLSEGATFEQLSRTWEDTEDVWAIVTAGCAEDLNDAAFIDLTTEMEGVRNRYAVEKGHYSEAVETYKAALRVFPGSWFGRDFEPL